MLLSSILGWGAGVTEDLLNMGYSSTYMKEEEKAVEISGCTWMEDRESLKTPEREAVWCVGRTERPLVYGNHRKPGQESPAVVDTKPFFMRCVQISSSQP